MSNPKTLQVFEDLEAYEGFCKEYGYKFDPSMLYNKGSRIWRLYSQRFKAGLPVNNMWDIDGERFKKKKHR